MTQAIARDNTTNTNTIIPKNETLFEITCKHLSIGSFFRVNPDTGEVLEDSEDQKKELNALTANKMDGIGDLISMKREIIEGFKEAIEREKKDVDRLFGLVSRAAAIRPEIAKLGHRRKFRLSTRLDIKDVGDLPVLFQKYTMSLTDSFDATDIKRKYYWMSQILERPISSVADAFSTAEIELIKNKIKLEPNKESLKKALKDGQHINGVSLVKNYNLIALKKKDI